MSDKFLKIVRTLKTDYEPYGEAEPGKSDCSSGCRHFLKLAGEAGEEWGVCANPVSERAGLLTYQHQGCPEFESILLDRALTDAQLRTLIADASEILKDRRRVRTELVSKEGPWPDKQGQFMYDLKTTHFPHIKGHVPVIFRLEHHDGGFVAIPLESRNTGSQRPTLMCRHPAKNGEVFKIVRANGDYSYQVPFNGKIYNLKQYGNLSDIGLAGLETLRSFLERVESETFEQMTREAQRRLKSAKRSLEETRDRLKRWKNREFWRGETPTNKREYQEMLKELEDDVEQLPTQITANEAYIEWLRSIDRSSPTLRSVPPPSFAQRK
jgi:DNA-directed RNA polymerase subunit H (RpoH/RPB5)